MISIVIYFFLFFNIALHATEFSGERAYNYLLAQCDFGPRPPGSINHKKLQEWLVKKISETVGEIKKDEFYYLGNGHKDTLKLMNISVFVKGCLSDCYLLCAHYDTRPWADRDPKMENRKKPILGANDGASGVAVLLEMARIFKKKQPYYSVELVLFDGEDYGSNGLDDFCIGSKHFAQKILPEYYKGAIIVDMVGDRELDIFMEKKSVQNAPELMVRLWNIADELDSKSFINRQGSDIYDDHVPLIEKGIKAVDIIDFNYKYWHTMQDTPDKCSPQSLEEVGKVIEQFFYGGGK